MYLVEAHWRLGAVRGCARHFGGDNVVAGSVDAFSFVVSGVLLAPAGEYRFKALSENFDNHLHLWPSSCWLGTQRNLLLLCRHWISSWAQKFNFKLQVISSKDLQHYWGGEHLRSSFITILGVPLFQRLGCWYQELKLFLHCIDRDGLSLGHSLDPCAPPCKDIPLGSKQRGYLEFFCMETKLIKLMEKYGYTSLQYWLAPHSALSLHLLKRV